MLELEEEAEKLREVQTLAERQLMYNPLAGKLLGLHLSTPRAILDKAPSIVC